MKLPEKPERLGRVRKRSKDSLNEGSTRSIVGNVVAATALIAGLVVYSVCTKDDGANNTETTQEQQFDIPGLKLPKPNIRKEATNPKISVSPDKIPKIEISSEKYKVPVPDGLEMTQDEFEKASQELSKKVRALVETDLSGEHPKEREASDERLETFVKKVVAIAEEEPVFRSWLEKAKTDDKDLRAIGKKLGKLLEASDLYFKFEYFGTVILGKDKPKDGGYDLPAVLHLYDVRNKNIVGMSDGVLDSQIVANVLGNQIFDNSPSLPLGTFESNAKTFNFYYERGKKSVKKGFESDKIGKYYPDNMDLHQLFADFAEESTKHEAVHGYLSDKFPIMGNLMDIRFGLKVFLRMPIMTDRPQNFDAWYIPVHFHEACAVGAELYHSKSEVPVSYSMYLFNSAGENKDYRYTLVNKLLPVLTLRYAPDSQLKREIWAKALSGVPTRVNELIDLVHKTYGRKDIQRVGAILYNIGFQLMTDAEEGRFEPRLVK